MPRDTSHLRYGLYGIFYKPVCKKFMSKTLLGISVC